MEPAQKVERAMLEHAGLVEKKGQLDAQLVALMGTMSDNDKRRMLFALLNPPEDERKAS